MLYIHICSDSLTSLLLSGSLLYLYNDDDVPLRISVRLGSVPLDQSAIAFLP